MGIITNYNKLKSEKKMTIISNNNKHKEFVQAVKISNRKSKSGLIPRISITGENVTMLGKNMPIKDINYDKKSFYCETKLNNGADYRFEFCEDRKEVFTGLWETVMTIKILKNGIKEASDAVMLSFNELQ